MPPWWGKSSSKKAKKKAYKDTIIDAIYRRFKSTSEDSSGPAASQRVCNDTVSGTGSHSRENVQSPSFSALISRSLSFSVQSTAQPVPLPGGHHIKRHYVDSGRKTSKKPGRGKGCTPSLFCAPLSRPGNFSDATDTKDADLDLGTASVFTDSSSDSDDLSDSRLLSPQVSENENSGKTAGNSPSSLKQKDHINTKKISGDMLKPSNLLLNNQNISTSSKHQPFGSFVPNLQIPPLGAYCSAPASPQTSPSRSPMRLFRYEPAVNCGPGQEKPHADVSLLGSGHCSSPDCCHNSGHNSVGGDISGQILWQHSRWSPECSPALTPRMGSPIPSSQVQSGALAPLHPRAKRAASESTPVACSDDGKQQSYRLPLPPAPPSSPSPLSPPTLKNSVVPRSPGLTENPPKP